MSASFCPTLIGGRLMSSVSATGVETTYDYDDLGRTIEVTDERGVSTFTGYDTSGRVSWTKDGDDNQTNYVYYTGEEWDEAEPEDQPYIHPGRLKYVENPADKKTRFGYDDHGRTLRTWGDVPYPTENEFDEFGQRTALRTFRGGSGWDGSEWPESPGAADETTWTYDEATGLLNTKEYADATEVNYTYTEEGHLYTRQWARHSASDVTTYGYDAATGELLSVTYDESFNMTNVAYTYDRLGRQATVSDAAGSRTFAYDAATLELASETFTSGMFNGLVIKPDHEDGSGGTLEGRWAGLRVGTSGDDDAHYLVHYGYDATGRLSRVTGPGLPAGSGASHGAFYTFVSNSDLVDQVRYKVDGGDVRAWVDRSYEAERDLVTSVENNFGDLTTYTTVSKYAYGNDALARRTDVVRTGAAFGGTGGSGDHLDLWSYNDRNELTGSQRYADTDAETPEDPVAALDRAYGYDPIGNRTSSEDGATPTEWAYDTNALNQYERVDTVGDALIRQGYSFDADGNLAEQWLIGDATCDGLLNSFDVDSFVATVGDPNSVEPPVGYEGDAECWSERYGWADVNGDTYINNFDVDPFVDLLVGGQAALARQFTWNAENRLVMAAPVQSPPPLGAQRVKFVYDYMGRRVEKLVETWTDDTPDDLWVATSRARYIYDGWLPLLELDALDSNAVVRQYTWGLDLAGLSGAGFQPAGSGGTGVPPVSGLHAAGGIGGLLAVHDETVESGEDYVYLYDANGNVGQLVAFEDGYGDATGNEWHTDRLVARYEYDAYGRITGPDTDDDGDWRDDAGPYATTNVIRFSTKPWDDEIGWGNWGERLYDPRIGRWGNRDPIEEAGGWSVYAYVFNQPVRYIDANGRQPSFPGVGPIRPDGSPEIWPPGVPYPPIPVPPISAIPFTPPAPPPGDTLQLWCYHIGAGGYHCDLKCLPENGTPFIGGGTGPATSGGFQDDGGNPGWKDKAGIKPGSHLAGNTQAPARTCDCIKRKAGKLNTIAGKRYDIPGCGPTSNSNALMSTLLSCCGVNMRPDHNRYVQNNGRIEHDGSPLWVPGWGDPVMYHCGTRLGGSSAHIGLSYIETCYCPITCRDLE